MRKILIVGGVAGGATAAARLRRLDEDAQIIMFERTGYVSYANCGEPYFIGGSIQRPAALTLQTPQSFRARFNIDVRVRSEVTEIRRGEKTVTVRELDTGREYTESYDKLILSPGVDAQRPGLPGEDGERVFTLRTVEDTFRIKDFLDRETPERAVIVGGGFIGLEMAENLMDAGVEVTLLQRSAQVMPPLDGDMAAELHAHLRAKGVDLRFHQSITGYEATEDGVRVQLADGESIDCGMVLLAVGVTPDTALAARAGLALGQKGAIVVDSHLRTSDPDIYAAGDAVEVIQPLTGGRVLIPLAGPANRQGRIIADNLCGIESEYKGTLGASVVKVFDMTAACVGLNEKTAKAAGIPYDKVVNYSASHATYYPGGHNMTLKTLFDPDTGRILGAQITGFDGVDKRIDVLSTAIQAHMTGEDLSALELAYAPPFSSAKDAVNMAGFAIENVRSGLVAQHHWDDVAALPRDGSVVLLDVRGGEEFARGHIPGAVNLPLPELRERLGELDKSKKLYVNCYSGMRSYIACRILAGHGFACSNLSGGWRFYELASGDSGVREDAHHPCGERK